MEMTLSLGQFWETGRTAPRGAKVSYCHHVHCDGNHVQVRLKFTAEQGEHAALTRSPRKTNAYEFPGCRTSVCCLRIKGTWSVERASEELAGLRWTGPPWGPSPWEVIQRVRCFVHLEHEFGSQTAVQGKRLSRCVP